jgi:hypothetical protein
MLKRLTKNWPDYVLTIGGITFGVSLVPTLLDPNAVVPLATSVPTALGLGMFAVTMTHLKLRFAALSNATTAALWGLIALMRHG